MRNIIRGLTRLARRLGAALLNFLHLEGLFGIHCRWLLERAMRIERCKHEASQQLRENRA
jgi:hypothetical protein